LINPTTASPLLRVRGERPRDYRSAIADMNCRLAMSKAI